MANMMTSMRHMFDQLSQGMRDIGLSHVANKGYLVKPVLAQHTKQVRRSLKAPKQKKAPNLNQSKIFKSQNVR